MAWQDTLIKLYLYVLDHYQGQRWGAAQRLSNNNQPAFTDEEVLTIYLGCISSELGELIRRPTSGLAPRPNHRPALTHHSACDAHACDEKRDRLPSLH